jgi:DNA polymerase III sliding clamp (beta) subunit (PCNA family)
MLKALKFCQGAVAKKDFLPALTNFVIEYGRIRSFNGVLALCSPIPFDIACKPAATTLIKAIANCEDTVQLSLTKAGRLSIKSGKFKAFVDCIQGDTVHAVPEGLIVNFDGVTFLKGLKTVAPFIGSDASRPWANGVLFERNSFYATNNVMLVQYWLGFDFGSALNVPREAVQEMLRIGEPPTYAQVAQGSITFHYEGDRWLRTQLFDTKGWPNIDAVLDKASTQQPIQEGLFKALSVVKPFVDKAGVILFEDEGITTHTDETEGASYGVQGLKADGKYNIAMLEILEGSAVTIDWSLYPKPALFCGENLRGAIVGMKK